MKIYGKEVEFRITNIDNAKNFQDAIKNMETNEKAVHEMAALVKQGKASLYDLMEIQMKMFRAFFKECVGEDVLVDCRDLQVAKNTYHDFIADLGEQMSNYSDEDNAATNTGITNIMGAIDV